MGGHIYFGEMVPICRIFMELVVFIVWLPLLPFEFYLQFGGPNLGSGEQTTWTKFNLRIRALVDSCNHKEIVQT